MGAHRAHLRVVGEGLFRSDRGCVPSVALRRLRRSSRAATVRRARSPGPRRTRPLGDESKPPVGPGRLEVVAQPRLRAKREHPRHALHAHLGNAARAHTRRCTPTAHAHPPLTARVFAPCVTWPYVLPKRFQPSPRPSRCLTNQEFVRKWSLGNRPGSGSDFGRADVRGQTHSQKNETTSTSQG